MPGERVVRGRSILIRLILSFIVAATVMYVAGPKYVRALLPLFAKEIEQFHGDYTVVSQELVTEGRSDQIRTRVHVDRDIVDSDGITRHGFTITVAQYSFNLYVHPIIVLTMLGAWPFRRKRDRFAALGIACPLLLAVLMLDMPFHVLYYVEKSHGSPRLIAFWFHFLGTGGRQFLSLLVAAVSILAVQERAGTVERTRRPTSQKKS
jgi:hypothetical protein